MRRPESRREAMQVIAAARDAGVLIPNVVEQTHRGERGWSIFDRLLKDRIVFLHSVQEGPASRSYGIQVAQLAGVPAAVLRAARRRLAQLEERAARQDLQGDLFSRSAAEAETHSEDAPEHPALAALRALDPDGLSPRDALEALYRLKKSLD